jgi:hypothetical protein
MPRLVNRAKMTTATTGTGTITLGSASSGYQTFAAAGVADGEVVRYVIEDGTAWEIGEGIYTSSGTTLTRTVLESSNSDTAISLSGSAVVFVSAVAEDHSTSLMVQRDNPDTYLVSCVSADPTASGNATSNTIYALPLTITRRVTVTRIGMAVATGAVGNGRLGIYEDANGNPGRLVLDAGTVDTSTLGQKEITISQVLRPGLYWLVLVTNGTVSVTIFGGTDIVPILGFTSALARSLSKTRTFTYAALPADESAQTYAFATSAPVLWVRAA